MLVNNITSAFVHDGKPVANGSLEVYTDSTTSQLANLEFINGTTAPNPAQLNSNGGIGHPIICKEPGLAYCVVKNSQGAVLFSYSLADNVSFKNIIFPNSGGIIEINTTGDIDYFYNQTLIDNKFSKTSEQIENLQKNLNIDVQTDISIKSDESTVSLDLEYANLSSGAKTSDSLPLPVASEVEAGVINAATFIALRKAIKDIDGMVGQSWLVMDNLGPNPTAEQVNAAWLANTGGQQPRDGNSVINLDTNELWKYGFFEGAEAWVKTSGQFNLPSFTNAMLGGIKGSLGKYQIFAEPDGTGSVNGLDLLESIVNTNTENIANCQPFIEAGTTAQYFRGDKSWRTLPGSPWIGGFGGRGVSDGNIKWQRTWRVNANLGNIDDNEYAFFVNGSYSMSNSFILTMRKDFRQGNWDRLTFQIQGSGVRDDAKSSTRFTSDGTYIYLEIKQTYGGAAVWGNAGTLLNETTTVAPAYCWTCSGVAGNGTSGNWRNGRWLVTNIGAPNRIYATDGNGDDTALSYTV